LVNDNYGSSGTIGVGSTGTTHWTATPEDPVYPEGYQTPPGILDEMGLTGAFTVPIDGKYSIKSDIAFAVSQGGSLTTISGHFALNRTTTGPTTRVVVQTYFTEVVPAGSSVSFYSSFLMADLDLITGDTLTITWNSTLPIFITGNTTPTSTGGTPNTTWYAHRFA
jgi:hypothetical protein